MLLHSAHFYYHVVLLLNIILIFDSHLACDEERTEAAKLLVEHGASIYIENKEKMTPLQVAKGGLGNVLKRIVEGWWTFGRDGTVHLQLLNKLLFKNDEYLAQEKALKEKQSSKASVFGVNW